MNLSNLSPESRRVMLSEAAGWKCWDEEFGNGEYWTPPDKHEVRYGVAKPPDYDTSLDACHDLEAKLTDGQCVTYQARLTEIIASDVYEMDGEVPCPAAQYWFHASSPQRASALLLTLVEGIEL